MKERKDLISANDHRTLYQNIDELLQLSEDILEQLLQNDHDPQIHYASRVYLSKTTAICAAYKKYCNGLKRADCVLVSVHEWILINTTLLIYSGSICFKCASNFLFV